MKKTSTYIYIFLERYSPETNSSPLKNQWLEDKLCLFLLEVVPFQGTFLHFQRCNTVAVIQQPSDIHKHQKQMAKPRAPPMP